MRRANKHNKTLSAETYFQVLKPLGTSGTGNHGGTVGVNISIKETRIFTQQNGKLHRIFYIYKK